MDLCVNSNSDLIMQHDHLVWISCVPTIITDNFRQTSRYSEEVLAICSQASTWPLTSMLNVLAQPKRRLRASRQTWTRTAEMHKRVCLDYLSLVLSHWNRLYRLEFYFSSPAEGFHSFSNNVAQSVAGSWCQRQFRALSSWVCHGERHSQVHTWHKSAWERNDVSTLHRFWCF